jgi:beta-aspartyl-peptidase (threonine type)
LTPTREKFYRDGLEEAVRRGHLVLEAGGTALDAVETAVRALEDHPGFNAGRGSVFNHDGQHEMDASIMDGTTLMAGAVACVQNVKNPVTLARRVMLRTPHVLLSGMGAFEFAHREKIELEDDLYFHDDLRYEQWKSAVREDGVRLDHGGGERKFGTVGAVALDAEGHLAAATSTGGMTNKRWQRIGDSPIIGAGTYANDRTCAISCTGHGESFLRAVAAHDVHALIDYAGKDLEAAVQEVIHRKLPPIGGEGGLIAVDRTGRIILDFNCPGMYRAWSRSGSGVESAIFR